MTTQAAHARSFVEAETLVLAELKARRLFEAGEFEACAALVEPWLERHPESVELRRLLLRVRYRQGNLEQAMRLLHQCLLLDPLQPEDWQRLAHLLDARGETAAAVTAYARAVQLLPDELERSSFTVRACVQFGQFEQAIPLFERLDAAQQLDDEHLALFAQASFACGASERAERLYERLAQSSSGSHAAFAAMACGQLLWQRGQTEQGLQWLQRCMASGVEPHASEASSWLGRALASSREPVELEVQQGERLRERLEQLRISPRAGQAEQWLELSARLFERELDEAEGSLGASGGHASSRQSKGFVAAGSSLPESERVSVNAEGKLFDASPQEAALLHRALLYWLRALLLLMPWRLFGSSQESEALTRTMGQWLRPGSGEQPALWQQLDELLARPFELPEHEEGPLGALWRRLRERVALSSLAEDVLVLCLAPQLSPSYRRWLTAYDLPTEVIPLELLRSVLDPSQRRPFAVSRVFAHDSGLWSGDLLTRYQAQRGAEMQTLLRLRPWVLERVSGTSEALLSPMDELLEAHLVLPAAGSAASAGIGSLSGTELSRAIIPAELRELACPSRALAEISKGTGADGLSAMLGQLSRWGTVLCLGPPNVSTLEHIATSSGQAVLCLGAARLDVRGVQGLLARLAAQLRLFGVADAGGRLRASSLLHCELPEQEASAAVLVDGLQALGVASSCWSHERSVVKRLAEQRGLMLVQWTEGQGCGTAVRPSKGMDEGEGGGLARLLHPTAELEMLVLEPEIRSQLDELLSFFGRRAQMQETWGEAMSGAVTALFEGPSGTGKTVAAHAVARAIGLPVLEVDLSRVLSRYVGEAEKRLARLFDESERHAVLLMDEADSLFAKRTKVKRSGDRHANLVVNFLLQRLDDYRGVLLLTSSHASRIDEAFARRFRFRVSFRAPKLESRRLLWEHFLSELPCEPGIELAPFLQPALTGAQIQVAIMFAASHACEDGGLLCKRHLQRGLQRVLRDDGFLIKG